MAAAVGRGEENVTNLSQVCQKKEILMGRNGANRSQHGKVALELCFYPIWGIYGEVSCVPLQVPATWGGMARLLELLSALRFSVHIPPRCFCGA